MSGTPSKVRHRIYAFLINRYGLGKVTWSVGIDTTVQAKETSG